MPVAAHALLRRLKFVRYLIALEIITVEVMCSVVQDNRESGENPERSRRCVSGVFF